MPKKWVGAALLLLCLFLIGTGLATGASTTIGWSVMGGGDVSGSTATISLNGTVGQWAATNELNSGSFGFWGGVSTSGSSVDPDYSVYLPAILKN